MLDREKEKNNNTNSDRVCPTTLIPKASSKMFLYFHGLLQKFQKIVSISQQQL